MSAPNGATITIPALTPEDVAKLAHDNSIPAPVELPKNLRRRVKAGAQKTVTASRADHVSAEDMAELGATVAVVERAQEQAAQAQAVLTKAVGIAEYVGAKVRQRYNIGPRDSVQADGTIVRGPQETSA